MSQTFSDQFVDKQLLSTLFAMASRFSTRRESKETGQDGHKQSKAPAERNREFVAKFRLWAKGALAPYPSEDGNPLYTGDLEPEEFLAEKRVAESRNANNCEWLLRPGMALSFTSAAIRTGLRELKAPDKNLESFAAWLKSRPKFADAVKILDVGTKKTPDKKHIRSSVSAFVDLLFDLPTRDREALTGLALRSARLYLLAMNLLEAMDLIRHPKLFAKKMAKACGGGPPSEDVACWWKHPEDSKMLKEMLAKALIKKVQAHEQSGQRSKKRRSSSGASASPSESPTASGRAPSALLRSSTPARRSRKKLRRSSSSPCFKRSLSPSLPKAKPNKRTNSEKKRELAAKEKDRKEKKAKQPRSPSLTSREEEEKGKAKEDEKKDRKKRSRSASGGSSRAKPEKKLPRQDKREKEERTGALMNGLVCSLFPGSENKHKGFLSGHQRRTRRRSRRNEPF